MLHIGIYMYRIVFSCHSSEESEVSEPLFVMLQGSRSDDDGRREVRGLDSVVAADVQRSEAAAHSLPPSAGGEAQGRHRPVQLELRARTRDVTTSQLKAAAAVSQVWLFEAIQCVSSPLQAARSGRAGAGAAH